MTLKTKPLIIAHRGANKIAPENTRAAFDLALTSPIDGIEFDVQLSKDHIPVLYHDRTLAKVNGTRKRISQLTIEELKENDWGKWFGSAFEKEPLLTLSEILNQYGAKTQLLVEIKSRPKDQAHGTSSILTKKTIELIEQIILRKHWDTIYILSYDPRVLAQVNEMNSKLKCVLNLRTSLDVEDISLNETNFYGICIPVKSLNSDIKKIVNKNGYTLFTHACNISSQLNNALQYDADFILSDKPDWCLKRLEESW